MTLFTLGLLLPAMFRWQRRRTGRPVATLATRRGRLRLMAMLAVVVIGLLSGLALAADGDPDGSKTGIIERDPSAPAVSIRDRVTGVEDATAKNTVAINTVWLMVGGVLVLFMQAGFALVETGFTRAKNAAHTVSMNLVIFVLGVVGWYVAGYALMFGSVEVGALGVTALGEPWHVGAWNVLSHHGFFLVGKAYDVSILGFFFFQLVFMDATATIPTGALAERWKFKSFVVWGLFVSTLLYPIFGNWVWGGGFLSQLGSLKGLGHGYADFAGSSVVHAVGGISALWGAWILGPRLGKFRKDGTPNAIPGHHLPMAILGTFILLVGWMGFNGASTFAGTDLRLTVVITNTIISSSFATLAAMILMWRIFGKPDPSMTANGMLAGLVAITAPCAFVAPWAAAVIGTVAGLLVVGSVIFVERKLKIDDPVGAFSVHGANGIWGVLSLGLFADGTYGAGWNGVDGTVKGLFYGDSGQFTAQVIGAVVCIVFTSLVSLGFFKILKATVGMRVDEDVEIAGLDMAEMGALAYPDFLEAQGPVFVSVGDGDYSGGDVTAAGLREEVSR